MKRVCVDTHALIWYLSKPKRLGRAALRVLRQADEGRAEVLIPAIVPVELSLLRETGRRVVGPAEIEALLSARTSFRLLPLALDQALEFMLLGALDDPFDRLIVAAARCSKAALVTADSVLEASGLTAIVWD